MAEDRPQSIADRIAALKLNQGGQNPPPTYDQATIGAPTKRPEPPPPPRPSLPARPTIQGRTQSSNVPTSQDHVSTGGAGNLPEGGQPNGSANGMDGISRPALPPRTSTQSSQNPALPERSWTHSSQRQVEIPQNVLQTPALPPRRPSEAPSVDSRRQSDYDLSRRGSNESMSSIATARSGVSAISNGTSVTSQSDRFSIRAPSYDPSALPALPPKRTQEEKEADHKKHTRATASRNFGLKATKSTPNVGQKQIGTTPPPPARPSVRQPSIPTQANTIHEEPAMIEPPPPRRETLPPPPRKSALGMGLNGSTNTPPPLPNARPGSVPQTNGGVPPPVLTGSRPDLAALQASKPKLNGAASTSSAPPAASGPPGSCLNCRDFSAPDNHAARFPRQSIPSNDIGWLAQQLTAPFPSHTDQARALFTWLHHNIAYDTVAFFNHNVQPSTPQSTLASGLAVCEGYAALFAAMAMKVRLEAYVVSGHGKGYGYSKLQPGEPIPPYNAGHAWNAVKIDGGEWKLIDCCWGAGSVSGKNQPYQARFSPERFTQSNEDFGNDHYPGDKSKQFRKDGRVVTWEEYYIGNKHGCGADIFTGFVAEEGMHGPSFRPTNGKIQLSQLPGPTARFSFQKVCPHWDPVKCGKGAYYLYILSTDGLEGTQRNHVPFETNGDIWWCDVPVQDLGRPGGNAQIWVVTSFDGSDGRGLTIQTYRQRKGRCGMSFGGVCKWELAP